MSFWESLVVGEEVNPSGEYFPGDCSNQGFEQVPKEETNAYGEESNLPPPQTPNIPMSAEPYVSQSKADWTPTRDAFLVEQMIEQQTLGKRSDMGWSKDAWRNVLVAFNTKFGLKLYLQQLKSRLTLLRKQYFTVKELLEQNGFSWDKTYQSVVADDEIWEAYIAANPKAKQFRRTNFPLYEQLSLLFDSPTQPVLPYPELNQRPRRIPKLEDTYHCFSSSVASLPKQTEDGDSSFEEEISMEDYGNSKQKMDSKTTRRKRKRISPGNRIAAALESLVTASEAFANESAIMNERFQYEKCLEELQQVGGLDELELLEAVEFLRDEKNAIAFMTLKGPLRMSWLHNKCRQAMG